MATDEAIEIDGEAAPAHESPSGGWGSAQASAAILLQEHVVVRGSRILLHQNKPRGFACVSCSWAKPAHPHTV